MALPVRNDSAFRTARAFRGIFFIVLTAALDQLTKYLAYKGLYESGKGSCPLIPGVLSLQYLENRGAAFGMMQGRSFLFAVFAVLVIAAAFVCYMRSPAGRKFLPFRIAMTGLVSGALGNLIDRLFRGYVIDFIYFSIIDFPVFNVADICVSLSEVLLLVLILFVYKDGDLDWIMRKNRRNTHD